MTYTIEQIRQLNLHGPQTVMELCDEIERLQKHKRYACRWCGESLEIAQSTMCEKCWELELRIRSQPAIAHKILIRVISETLTTPQNDV